ncbi:ribosome biogenesis GTPase Der [Candidatus Formimonas warabiya]|uniref:GTPase Der n=1 Tax=Formimonas warabiya TaxID=1761012 RepID=A0A3G1L0P2_FORW1|nr:ribosome biogenesis GTPase Der [Candidatus Formimonas warabiya]ATW28356.1 ribosome biogenesis GTPase Der [Candidatus Formimonas warabiya]
MKPIVAIVGRPNVGKSTLFNRFTGGRTAIVEDTPGVTRDRLYRDAEWLGREFTVIDTGGIEFYGKGGIIETKVKQQAQLAIEEADVILFVVDGKAGISPDDEAAANLLRRSNKPVVLAVNKIENYQNQDLIYEFFNLGLGDPIPISAAHGMNTGDLLDVIAQNFPPDTAEDLPPETVKIAVIGRPNVGKSSLVNKILGEERLIVSDVAGTTRDAIDSLFEQDGKHYVIIDTAGMRRRARVLEPTERYSVIRSLRAIDRSDVVLMLIDALDGVTEQDKKIAGYAHEAGKGMIIVVNKWDALAKDDKTMNRFDRQVREEMAFLHYAPILYISALTGQRVNKILEIVDFVAEQQNLRVTTARLNEVIDEALAVTPPPTDKGHRLKIFYVTQIGVKPPKFVLFVNEPELLHFSYERYLENQFRKNFGFEGTAIWFIIRKREKEQA